MILFWIVGFIALAVGLYFVIRRRAWGNLVIAGGNAAFASKYLLEGHTGLALLHGAFALLSIGTWVFAIETEARRS